MAASCGPSSRPAGTSTYDYDSLGALTRVALPDGAQVDYTIDAGGRRIAVKRNGVLQQGFLYGRALGPAAELNADGTVKSRFIYATRDNVPDIMLRDGKTYRIDHRRHRQPRGRSWTRATAASRRRWTTTSSAA